MSVSLEGEIYYDSQKKYTEVVYRLYKICVI